MSEQPALHLPDYFPTMRYHPTEPAVMVMTQEELDALDAVWRETPYSPEEMAAAKEAQARQGQDVSATPQEEYRIGRQPRSPAPPPPPEPDPGPESDEPEPRSHHRNGR